MSVRIRYENTVEDFVALNRFHQQHSPAARRVRLRLMWLTAAAYLVATALLLLTRPPAPLAAALVALIALSCGLTIARIPGAIRRQTDRQVRRLYAEGSNRVAVGPHELELAGGDLVSRTPLSESRMRVEAVERVASEGGYTFIYFGALTAHVIPHAAVSGATRRRSPRRSATVLGRPDATRPALGRVRRPPPPTPPRDLPSPLARRRRAERPHVRGCWVLDLVRGQQ